MTVNSKSLLKLQKSIFTHLNSTCSFGFVGMYQSLLVFIVNDLQVLLGFSKILNKFSGLLKVNERLLTF